MNWPTLILYTKPDPFQSATNRKWNKEKIRKRYKNYTFNLSRVWVCDKRVKRIHKRQKENLNIFTSVVCILYCSHGEREIESKDNKEITFVYIVLRRWTRKLRQKKLLKVHRRLHFNSEPHQHRQRRCLSRRTQRTIIVLTWFEVFDKFIYI